MKIRLQILTIFFAFLSVHAQDSNQLETVLQKGHTKYMTCYDFSPDGKFLISGSLDNSLILWNITTTKQIRTFSGHTEVVRSVQFSPDGNKILTSSKDNKAIIYDIKNGRQLLNIELPKGELHEAHYSPDGKMISLIDGRDGIWMFDSESAEELGTFTKNYAAYQEHHLVDPTSTKVLSKHGYKGFVALDIKTKDTLTRMEFDKSFKMSFSPDGKTIAASSTKLFTQIFNAESGKLLAELRDENGEKCDGCNMHHAFSTDGKYIITASNRTKPTIWNVPSGKQLKQYEVGEKTKTPLSMKFNSTNDLVLVSFAREVFVYDVKSGKVKLNQKNERISYFDIKFSPDGNYIALPDENNAIGIWNARSGKRQKRLEGFQNHAKNDGLRFSYDNWTHMGILKYISMKKQVVLTPDNQSIIVGNIDSLVLRIDLKSGKILQRYDGHSQAVWAYDISPDGKVLATAGGDRKIILWDVETGKEIEQLRGHREVVFELEFSSDGTKLISSSWDGSIRVWNLESGRYRSVDMGNNSAYTVGFTPNDLYFIAGDLEDNVSFYEADAASSFRELVGHTGIIADFDFSADAKTFASCSWDGKLKVWDVLTGMLLAKMDQHQGQVYAVKFDPKDRFIASGGGDNDIILWNHTANQLLSRLEGHTDAVTSIEITSDGKRLISCSADGMVKLWDLDTYKEIYSRVQVDRNEWIATSPGGYFDGSSKGLNLVNYVSGLESIKISSLFDKYYSPGLIDRMSKGEAFDDRGENMNETLKESPLVAFHLSNTGKRSIPVEHDSVYTWKSDRLPLDISIDSKGKSLEEVRIYNNGKLVVKEDMGKDIVFRGGDKDMRNFEIPLFDGENEISAVVINEDRTESEPAHIFVSFDGEAAKTDLYVLTIGINDYKNSSYNLEYAVNDAKAFNKAVAKKSDSLFSNIFEYSITNDKAVKENIFATVKEIQQKIGPEDVFVFYYAGHGVMGYEANSENSDFFIVTHDVTNLYGSYEDLKTKAVSASEILENSIEIAAAKQLYIIDACHSGGALESFAVRGGAREKALAQLARSSGTFFLTASQHAQFANEVGSLQHGLFTYAILEVLSGKSGAAYDNKVTVNELKSYVEDRVPELSEEYHGSAQYPASYSYGQDFPLVIIH